MIKMTCRMLYILFNLSSFFILCRSVTHTNQFAVKIAGSSDLADHVASKYGFINKGQIGSLEGYYLFETHSIQKRSAEPSSFHTSLLQNDSMVHWCEQQVIKSRVKRSSIPPSEYSSFQDPLYPEQWFLHSDSGKCDMNVRPAWKRGYTGKGVVVCILDDGVQGNHPDLALNYDKEASYDINDADDDPSPKDDDNNKHGTRCAGEVAAVANNEFCGVGVAYNAKIGGVRMLDGSVTDTIEATALSLKPNHIHIYSASWGPEDDGKTVDGPGALAKIAFEDGIKKGRNGLGSIYVWASGNGGKKSDNCNCDGYTNLIYTISISSATESGYKPWYLEECSSTLATTYSSGTTSSDRNIVTVDVNYAYFEQLKNGKKPNPASLCTKGHTGTSASAPIAAGLCALALEANPKLTWRDMQYIIVLTSRSFPLLKEDGWIINGANRKVSTKFGYGLMDGDAMVRVAADWKTLPAQHICSTVPNSVRRIIPKRKSESVEASIYTDGCQNTKNYVKYAEHVQVRVTLQFHPRGGLHIMLVSPKNTTSSLLFPRPNDCVEPQDSFNDWPFMSVHFWGEEIAGNWKLIIHNAGKSNAEKPGTLVNWSIIFYGTTELPDCVKNKNCLNERNEEKPHSEHVYPIRDTSLSGDISIEKCKSSSKFVVVQENGQIFCASKCPAGFYGNTKDYECHTCDKSCYSCYGPSYNNCLTCPASYLLLNSTCVKHCPEGYFASLPAITSHANETHQCIPCVSSCLTCKDNSHNCILCKEGFNLFQHECVPVCPTGTYVVENKCMKCSKECSSCYGPLSSDCLACSDRYYLMDNSCSSECPEKHFIDSENRCVSCHRSCDSCNNQSGCLNCAKKYRRKQKGLCDFTCDLKRTDIDDMCYECDLDSCAVCYDPQYCDTCQEGVKWFGGSCYYNCPVSTYLFLDECKKCLGKCFSCTDNPYHCSSCQDGFYLYENSCVSSCPFGYYSTQQRICEQCHPSCEDCFGPSSYNCLSCMAEKYLINNSCRNYCPPGYYGTEYEGALECAPCHPTCEKCNGYGVFSCTECPPDRLLIDNACMPCPDGSFFKDKMCVKCHDECGTCYGPLSDQCTSCIAPLRLQEHLHICLPCCEGEVTNDCCECNNNLDVCIIHDQNLNNVNISMNIPQDYGVSPESYSKQIVTIAVVVSSVVTVMFVVLFCILQYRSSGSWHYGAKGKKYMPVPREINDKFNTEQEKICLTQEDAEEEDDLFLKT